MEANALDPQNVAIGSMTPLENRAVNGPWICNVGRDLGPFFERPRAEQAMTKGAPVEPVAIDNARLLIERAKRPWALVSTGGSNEELDAFKQALGERITALYKIDHVRQPGEPPQDDLLIRDDKNPNTAGASERFARYDGAPFDDATDLLLVWGEGFDFSQVPAAAQIILLARGSGPKTPRPMCLSRSAFRPSVAGTTPIFRAPSARSNHASPRKDSVAHAEEMFFTLALQKAIA